MIYLCPGCDQPVDPGPMPEEPVIAVTRCPCTRVQQWVSGIREPVRFIWYPVFRCQVSWCKDREVYMTPVCPEHWNGVPQPICQDYWKAKGVSMTKALRIAGEIAIKIESGAYGHKRHPETLSFEIEF